MMSDTLSHHDSAHIPVVLVVDDQPANLDVLLEHLAGEDLRLLVATGGLDALRLAEEVKPDLILLDVMMPDLDGYAVLERLKQSGTTQHIPVVLLSAMADQVEEVRGLELGAVDYIAKPYSLPVLRARVRKHLHEKPAPKAARECVGLLTRADFMPQLEREWARCQRFRHDLSLLHIQIDPQGSAVSRDSIRRGLCQVAGKLQGQVRRASELLACMGHNQFAVLMPELGAAQAQANGLRLLQLMQGVQLPGGAMGWSLNASIGAATVTPCQGDTIAGFLEMAAEALREARQAGGNCVRSQ